MTIILTSYYLRTIFGYLCLYFNKIHKNLKQENVLHVDLASIVIHLSHQATFSHLMTIILIKSTKFYLII
jgi:hypothetical protein